MSESLEGQLYDAARDGEAAEVTRLLAAGAAVNWGNPDQLMLTPLHLAAVNHRSDCVRVLLTHPGCDVNKMTPLHWAAARDHSNCVRVLITHPGCDVNARNKRGATPLHRAAARDHSDCVRVLLSHPGCDVDARAKNKETPLMWAAWHNHLEVAALLLQAGADTQAEDEDGETALDKAGSGGDKTLTADMRRLLTGEVPPSKYLRPEDMGTARGGDLGTARGGDLGTARDWTKGDATASDWTDEEKRGLTESNSLRVIYMGDFMAGKTSLVRTIISGGSYMSQVDDRTVIAEINHWVPDPKQRKTFSMVDLGGHQSYLSSGHYFHTNSPNNVSTLCHDITNMDYLRSFLWIKSFMTRSPESHIIAALTQCDKLEQSQRIVKLDNFLKEVSKYLGQEIESLEDTIAMAQSNRSSKVETFKDLKKKYEDFRKKLLSKEVIFLVSCKPGYEHYIDRLTSFYVQLSEQPENLVIMPEHWHTFHSIIGRMGVKINLIMLAKESRERIQTKAISETSRKSQKSKTSKSNDSPSSSSQQEQEGTDIVRAQQYLKLDEATEQFLSVLKSYKLSHDNLDEQTMQCLQSFHKHGFVMYFTGTPQLRQYIFNNISTFVSILRCIFHHDLQEMLLFRNIPAEVRAKCYSNQEQPFAQDLELLRNEGLLSQQLLTVLLQQGHCDIEASVITDLLVTLEVGFLVQPEGVNTVQVFIPYFIEKREISPSIKSQINAIVQCNDSFLSLHCQVSGNLPTTYWSYVMVAVLKFLDSSMLRREVWKFGLLANLGNFNGKLLLSYNGKDKVDFCIRANISKLGGHRFIWEHIIMFSAENDRLMTSWWPGLVTRTDLLCTHCSVNHQTPHKWDLDDDILSKRRQLQTFQCRNEANKELPVALIRPLPQDAAAAQEAHSDLLSFLKNSTTKHEKPEVSVKRKDTLNLENRQKSYDDLLHKQGTKLLRELLLYRVQAEWGADMQTLLNDPAKALPSDPFRDERRKFQKLLLENNDLRLFIQDKQKIKEGDIDLFDITLLVKLLKTPSISGFLVDKPRWGEIQKGGVHSMLHPQKAGKNKGSRVDDTSTDVMLAGAILLISAYRNDIHNKTDKSQQTQQELEEKTNNLKEALESIAEFLGIPKDEVFSLQKHETTTVYVSDVHTLRILVDNMTPNQPPQMDETQDDEHLLGAVGGAPRPVVSRTPQSQKAITKLMQKSQKIKPGPTPKSKKAVSKSKPPSQKTVKKTEHH